MENYAAFLTEIGKQEIRKTEMPEVKPGCVLVKIQAVGVCGSDIHYFKNGRIGDFVVQFPMILGHECSGVVVQVADDVKNLHTGDRVALEPGVPCGKCEMCISGKYNLCPDVVFFATPPINGANQNYVVHPANWTFKLPDNITFEQGALIEPLAIGMHASYQGGIKAGDTALIMGAGCIGLVSLLAAKASGASKVIVSDILENRLNKAKQLGALTVNSSKEDLAARVSEITGGQGADVVIDAAGTKQTLQLIPYLTKPDGTAVLVGQAADKLDDFNYVKLMSKEITLKTVFRYRHIYPRAIAAVASGDIDISGIVSCRYSFDQIQQAYEYVCRAQSEVIKCVIAME